METTSTLSGNLWTYYHKQMLETAKSNLKLWGLGKQKTHPKGFGTDSYVLKFGHVAASTTALTEGITPTETTIDSNKYTIVLNQYGQYIRLSDWLQLTAINDTLDEVVKELGYTAALSTDQIIRDNLIANATTSIQYVGSGNTADNDIAANEVFTGQDVIKGTRILKTGDAPMIDGYYAWVVHPLVASDLMSDTSAGGFIELNKYVDGLANKPLNGEIGKLYGARVVESSNMTSAANAGTVNVYRTLLLAKDAFCTTAIDKDHVDLIVKQAGSAGTSDPLNQVATAGYKMQFGVKYVGGSFSGHNGASPDLCIQIRGAATGG